VKAVRLEFEAGALFGLYFLAFECLKTSISNATDTGLVPSTHDFRNLPNSSRGLKILYFLFCDFQASL